MNELRVLHTSDWHLGKKLYKYERLTEQKLFLEWLTSTIKSEKINLLLIAGDIFDVPTPPNSAQKLFYDFIYDLGQFEDLKTIIIPGNHDSAHLLDIPKYFFEKSNCFIFPYLEKNLKDNEIVINSNGINIGVKALPYFRNHELLNRLGDHSAEDFFTHFFSTWETKQNLDAKILIAHHGFGKYSAAGSEHAIYLSGLEYFPLEWVSPHFDYSALGHIHRKQTLKEDPYIIYPGSPIPLRFSETDKKYVSLYKVSAQDKSQRYIQVPTFRKLIRVKGDQKSYLKELTKSLDEISKDELPAYLEIEIELDEPVAGLSDNIRQFIQNKNIELVSFRPIFKNTSSAPVEKEQWEEFDLDKLFSEYYKVIFPDSSEVPPMIIEDFKNLVEDIQDETP